MPTLVSEIPILIFRLAIVAICAVTLGGLLVIFGASWHVALFWASRVGLVVVLMVFVYWVWRGLTRNDDAAFD